MQRIAPLGLLFLALVYPSHDILDQVRSMKREPAVAGQFYPASPLELRRELDELFSHAVPSKHLDHLLGIIVPHAAYAYSGQVAASGFNQIDRTRTYENIFIIGPSHYVDFTGASVFTAGDFGTPLGTVGVNREVGQHLIATSSVFTDRVDAQEKEHSIEVEIPFLQYLIGDHFRIVPIVVGDNSPVICQKVAEALRPYFNERNLFIISSDFSHYPASVDAIRTDSMTAAAILSNSPMDLQSVLAKNERSGIPNLATSLCGRSAVMTFLYLTSAQPAARFTRIQYCNSGDSQIGQRDRVVGYYALAAYNPDKQETQGTCDLDLAQRNALLAIARETLEHCIRKGGPPAIDSGTVPAVLKMHCGAFVTLNKNGRLRGCIGRFDPGEPLYKVVQDMAVAAATQDFRFDPVAKSELSDVRIEISVLTPMRKIHSIEEFDPNENGIYMRKGDRSGTFLPQVEKETGWSKEELLGHCAQEKAGIGWNGWMDAELFVYDAIVFGELP